MNEQDQLKAHQLFNRSGALIQEKKYADAVPLLQESWNLDQSNPEKLQMLGFLFKELGDLDTAYGCLTDYLHYRPEKAKAYVNRAALGLKLKLFNEAIGDYTKAAALDPDDVMLLIWLANAYDSAGRYPEALEVYARAIVLKPNEPVVYYERGLAHHNNRAFRLALADFNQCLALDPTNKDALEMKNQALVAEHQVRGREPGDVERQLLRLTEQADQADASGDFEAAIALFTEAIDMAPGNAIIFNNRGYSYQRRSLFEEAIGDYTSALAIQPDYVQALMNRGSCLLHLGEYEDALADFSAILDIDDRNTAAYFNMGEAYRALGDHERAVDCFSSGIKIDDTDADFFLKRGKCYELLKRTSEALADFTFAVSLAPGNAETYINRGNILYDLKRHQSALSDFTRAAQIDPHSAIAQVNVGATLQELGQPEQAAEAFKRAVAADENYAFSYVKLGWHYLRSQNPEPAAACFAKAKLLGHPGGDEGLDFMEEHDLL